jgi:hypothetical protein
MWSNYYVRRVVGAVLVVAVLGALRASGWLS